MGFLKRLFEFSVLKPVFSSKYVNVTLVILFVVISSVEVSVPEMIMVGRVLVLFFRARRAHRDYPRISRYCEHCLMSRDSHATSQEACIAGRRMPVL